MNEAERKQFVDALRATLGLSPLYCAPCRLVIQSQPDPWWAVDPVAAPPPGGGASWFALQFRRDPKRATRQRAAMRRRRRFVGL